MLTFLFKVPGGSWEGRFLGTYHSILPGTHSWMLLRRFLLSPSSESWLSVVKPDATWSALVPPSYRKDAGSLGEKHPRVMPIQETTHSWNPTSLLTSCSPDPDLSALPLLKTQLRYRFLQGAPSDFSWARLGCVFPLGSLWREHLLKFWI